MPLSNGWTGGQYSVFRLIFGVYLLQHFLFLIPWAPELFSREGLLADKWASPLIGFFPSVFLLSDAPAVSFAAVGTGALLCIPFAIGWKDRWAAAGLWYVWACLFTRNPLISNPSLPYVGWLLLAHACLPKAPFGSQDAAGRTDPAGDWKMDGGIYFASWVLLAAGYSYSGYTKLVSPSWIDGTAIGRVLENPLVRPTFLPGLILMLPPVMIKVMTWGALALELLFAPLALSKRLRPWLWVLLLGMHLSLILLIDFADLSFGMMMIHLFTFDPGWIRPVDAQGEDILFYDGSCGLCHRFVRLALAEDASGAAFRFAPLGGETFKREIGGAENLPDSLVIKTGDGTVLTRTAAVRRLLGRFGGIWRLFGIGLGGLPVVLADGLYDGLARIRYRLFAKPPGACPMLPPAHRKRFMP